MMNLISNGITDMKIQHVYRTETNGDFVGRQIPVTLCQYEARAGSQ